MDYPAGTHALQYGNTRLEYELIFSERKTLAVHVYPDSSIVVDAPLGSELADIETKLRKRAPWILRQLRELSRYAPHIPMRRYVSGETHRFLGKQYRLKITEHHGDHVRLHSGYLDIQTPEPRNPRHIQTLVDGWLHAQAKFIFKERLDTCYPKVEFWNIPYPDLVIRPIRKHHAQEFIEFGAVVTLFQVAKFVQDDVINVFLIDLHQP